MTSATASQRKRSSGQANCGTRGMSDTIVEDRSRRHLQRRRPDPRAPTTTASTSTSAGPIGAARSAQGQPVIFQAGSSDTGRVFAARHAEVIFTGQGNRAVRSRVLSADRRGGRGPGRARPPLITPSLRFIVGSTEDEVHAHRAHGLRVLQPGVPGRLAARGRGGRHRRRPGWTGARLGVPGHHRDASDGAGRIPIAGRRRQPTVREFLYRTVNGWGAEGGRYAGADRRRDRGLVRGRGLRRIRPAGDSGLPGQFEDVRRTGGADPARAWAVPPGVHRHDVARSSRAGGPGEPISEVSA